MARLPVYLDYHATTPVDPRVVEAMLPCFTETFGNPASSSHSFGWAAQGAVDTARRQVAALIGASASDIVFTSGATESNNLALRGMTRAAAAGRRHLVVSAIEHKSVLEVARSLERDGWQLTVAPVGRDGRIDLAALREAVTDATALVSVMAANNEIGVTQSLAEIGAIAREHGAVFHVDAAQAVGKMPIDVEAAHIDLLSLTGHKMYGPKGCGAIFVREGTTIEPLLVGGGHEHGLRSGTLNTPGIVGLGAACDLCRSEMADEAVRIATQRDRLLEGLQAGVDGVTVNGSLDHRLPNNLHVAFSGVTGEALVISVGDIAVSSGSACSTGSVAPSHVLEAIHAEGGDSAHIRFGLGRFTTDDDITYAIDKFTTVVRHLRELVP